MTNILVIGGTGFIPSCLQTNYYRALIIALLHWIVSTGDKLKITNSIHKIIRTAYNLIKEKKTMICL